MLAKAAYTPVSSHSAPPTLSLASARPKGIADDYYDEVADGLDRDRYYASVKDTFATSSGDELFQSLHRLVSQGTRDLGYSGARKELYSTVDRRPDGNLYYLYSGDGPKNEGDVKEITPRELENYNCEHVVPQSWFNKAHPMKSDLHHLFTEESQCNGSRGNLELEEIPDGQGRAIEACGILQPGRSFEPKAGKGEVARATLYFVTRHPGKIGDGRETNSADIAQLIEWSREYPVSDYERHRNDKIEEVQGNRNPFIDFPELVEKVDFSEGFKS